MASSKLESWKWSAAQVHFSPHVWCAHRYNNWCNNWYNYYYKFLSCWCCLLFWFGTRLSLGLSGCGTRVLLTLRISLGRIQVWTLFILWLSRDRTRFRLGHLRTGISCLCLFKQLRGLLNLEHSILVYLRKQRAQEASLHSHDVHTDRLLHQVQRYLGRRLGLTTPGRKNNKSCNLPSRDIWNYIQSWLVSNPNMEEN